jgi:2-octaprenylphenol hydroxylase
MKSVDVLIAGGGIVGYTLATALGPLGLSVMLLDPNKGATTARVKSREHQTSNRVFTVRPSVRDFLRKIGIWNSIDEPHSQAVSKMMVYSGAGAPLVFDAYQAGFEQLATVVEYERLMRATLGAINPQSTNILEAGLNVATVKKDRVIVETTDGLISCRLLVGADGADSKVRRVTNINSSYHDYQYTGVVASFSTGRAHCGVAYQKFVDQSVIAFLPLSNNRTNLVWSLKNELSGELSEGNIIERVTALFNPLDLHELESAVGKFPLGKLTTGEVCKGRVALVGDSAHQFLPLAGQGLNVGLSDVQKLTEFIGSFGQVDPGSNVVMNRYRRARREEIDIFGVLTDMIHKSLIPSQRITDLFLGASFDAINNCQSAKRFLVNKAAGYDF